MNSIDVKQYLWCIPVFLTIHNLEEGIFARRMIHLAPNFYQRRFNSNQFRVALAVLTAGVYIITAVITGNLKDEICMWLLVNLQVVMGFNAIFPHLFITIWRRTYAPGVISGLAINLPFSIFLLDHVSSNGYPFPAQARFLQALALAILLMISLSIAGFSIGYLTINYYRKRMER